jgi:tetratricopeptide (TPR) repeat protein/S1-C subfamily serine protease
MCLYKSGGKLLFAASLLFCLGFGPAEAGTPQNSDSPEPGAGSPKPEDAPKAQTDALGNSLNLTPDSESLPVWTTPAPDATFELAHMIRNAEHSVFLVGKSGVGTGTGFLISKKNRLLATNAHVADIFYEGKTDMLAYQNDTSKSFKVVKVYIHPGVVRSSKGVKLRSPDSKVGDVVGRSSDVAVLQLAEGDELPEELPLGSQEELYDLFAQPIAMLGFPGTDTSGFPKAGDRAEATFREGVVNRVSDFTNNAGGPPERRQYLQHSMANWFGFSGSPIFLPNGHVVALNNSGGTRSQNGLSITQAWGIRADCVWEVLKANHLLDKVNLPPEAAAVDVERFSQPDPELKKMQQVDQLLADARIDLRSSRYEEALDKCNEAAKQLPNYADVYSTRGDVYINTASLNTKADDPKRKQYDESGLADKKHALQLDPDNTALYLDVAVATTNLANMNKPAGSKTVGVDSAIEVADKMLKDDSISTSNKVYAYRVRAAGMGYSPASIKYLAKADATLPFNCDVKWSMAIYYTINHNPQLSERQKALSQMFREAQAKSDTAFTLATSKDDSKRDGKRALQLATEAYETTEYKCYYALTALAVACAETGDFDHAVDYQKKAADAAPEFLRNTYAMRLAVLEKHKPVRS